MSDISIALERYIRQWQRQPFRYGVHDCVRFAVGWVDLRLGSKYLQDLPQWYPYTNESEALKIIRENGGLEDLITKHLGVPLPRLLVLEGDIALIDQTEHILGIATPHQVVGPSLAGGVIAIPRTFVRCGWRLG